LLKFYLINPWYFYWFGVYLWLRSVLNSFARTCRFLNHSQGRTAATTKENNYSVCIMSVAFWS
jgi:hypothetical protein